MSPMPRKRCHFCERERTSRFAHRVYHDGTCVPICRSCENDGAHKNGPTQNGRGGALPCAFCQADRSQDAGSLCWIQIDGERHPACRTCRGRYNANGDLDLRILRSLLSRSDSPVSDYAHVDHQDRPARPAEVVAES